MKVIVISKDKNDYSSTVDDYLRDFERQTGHKLDILNPDTVEGMQFCELYDVVEYPSIVAISDNGILQNSWRGLPLPTINELTYYIQ